MSLKAFLFLAPVAAGGWYVSHKDAPVDPAGNGTVTAEGRPVATPRKSREECLALEQQLLLAHAPGDRNPARTIAAVFIVERELSRQGCGAIDGDGRDHGFRPVSNRMGAAPSPAMNPAPAAPPRGVSFEPGRPMIDVSRGHSR